MDKTSKILISGAGVAGLTAALRLAKAGYKPVIVEKAPELRPGGYLVALSHQAYIFADEMGLIPDIKPHDMRIASSSYHDKTGRSLLSLDYSVMFQGLDIIQIMRDDLAKVLYEKAKDLAEIRFGEHITGIKETESCAVVQFASGKSEEYDLIIGADGAHSGVRHAVFDESEYTHHYLDLHCAAFRAPNVPNIQSKFETHMERERYMAIFNTRDGDLGAVFVWSNLERSLPKPEKRKEHLLSAFEGCAETTRLVLEHCPDEGPSYIDVLSQIEMPVWHKGRSVLVGDAAHCLTLFSGRGAAAAFAGACRLCDAIIANETYEGAFKDYEKTMRPIINDIMPATREAVRWYVPMNAKNHLLRNGLMRFVPNGVFRKYFQLKYSKV